MAGRLTKCDFFVLMARLQVLRYLHHLLSVFWNLPDKIWFTMIVIEACLWHVCQQG